MKILTPLVFLALAAAIFFWYIDPTYATVKTLLSQQNELGQALSRSRELQDVRDQLLSRYNTFPQTELDKLQKLLPDHIDNVRLILDLDSMAAKYGMRVRNVASENDSSRAAAGDLGADDSPYESVILSFTVTGPYTTFRQFLTDLEQSLRLMDVVGLSFNAADTGIYDFTLRVKTYWLKP